MLTIYLDLDGPILEGKFKHYHCYLEILKKYGGDPLPINDYWEMKRSMIKRNILLKASNFQGSYAQYNEEWLDLIEHPDFLQYDQLKPQVIETLVKWKYEQYKTILVTMRRVRIHLLNQLNTLGLEPYLHKIINCSPFENNSKYLAIKDDYSNNSIFIGDTEADTETAKMLGIHSIGITNGLRKKEMLRADYFFDEICNINFRFLSREKIEV